MDRWPGWIYQAGDEPDYRFTLANERTLLAWTRTALAMLAAGVAVDAVDLGLSPTVQLVLGILLVSLALVISVAAWFRWARTERRMRLSQSLPGGGLGVVVALVVAIMAVVVLVGR
ncbi:YidH family protein [Aeromicrobium sp. CF4.19]|uniref:YidH family protein n=1 Tax=Aeromicrobium sp. CF4.19 TaxID=3373082 RepID=UPI003EE6B08C